MVSLGYDIQSSPEVAYFTPTAKLCPMKIPPASGATAIVALPSDSSCLWYMLPVQFHIGCLQILQCPASGWLNGEHDRGMTPARK
jgi:hypothetical protein